MQMGTDSKSTSNLDQSGRKRAVPMSLRDPTRFRPWRFFPRELPGGGGEGPSALGDGRARAQAVDCGRRGPRGPPPNPPSHAPRRPSEAPRALRLFARSARFKRAGSPDIRRSRGRRAPLSARARRCAGREHWPVWLRRDGLPTRWTDAWLPGDGPDSTSEWTGSATNAPLTSRGPKPAPRASGAPARATRRACPKPHDREECGQCDDDPHDGRNGRHRPQDARTQRSGQECTFGALAPSGETSCSETAGARAGAAFAALARGRSADPPQGRARESRARSPPEAPARSPRSSASGRSRAARSVATK